MLKAKIHRFRSSLQERRIRVTAALVIGLLLAVGVGTLQAHAQAVLSNKLLRLHVVADSNDREDQHLKLLVRDAVLACPISRVPTIEEMRKVEMAARSCLRAHGSSEKIQVSYTRMYFDTREYPGFSLPAGYYQALRVVIGEGKGKNWWCVVYPALCTDLAKGEEELTEEELALIRKDGKKFLVRLKIFEAISGLTHKILE